MSGWIQYRPDLPNCNEFSRFIHNGWTCPKAEPHATDPYFIARLGMFVCCGDYVIRNKDRTLRITSDPDELPT